MQTNTDVLGFVRNSSMQTALKKKKKQVDTGDAVILYCSRVLVLSSSLSRAHTHTRMHVHIWKVFILLFSAPRICLLKLFFFLLPFLVLWLYFCSVDRLARMALCRLTVCFRLCFLAIVLCHRAICVCVCVCVDCTVCKLFVFPFFFFFTR